MPLKPQGIAYSRECSHLHTRDDRGRFRFNGAASRVPFVMTRTTTGNGDGSCFAHRGG
jgi:hypothetical protein